MKPAKLVMLCHATALASVFALGGCAFFGPKVQLDALTLEVSQRANNDTPIAVDFIAIRDPELLKQLSAIPARQWFAEREQYQRDYRDQLSVWSLELVPGQFMQADDFPLRGQAAAGLLVFAGYNSPGVHRLRLGDESKVRLRFDSRDMRLLGDEQTR
ncbi:type VI secretion system protein [Pseudomonas sp. TE3786]